MTNHGESQANKNVEAPIRDQETLLAELEQASYDSYTARAIEMSMKAIRAIFGPTAGGDNGAIEELDAKAASLMNELLELGVTEDGINVAIYRGAARAQYKPANGI